MVILRENSMKNPEKDDSYFEEVGKIFDDFFTLGSITNATFDLIKTRNGDCYCRNCATKVKHSRNCPHCNVNIDWNKKCIGMEDFVVVLLKNGKSDIVLEPIKVFADRMKSLPDNELIGLREGLFDNPKKVDAELIQASNWEVTRSGVNPIKLERIRPLIL
jgi:hypothetical protein